MPSALWRLLVPQAENSVYLLEHQIPLLFVGESEFRRHWEVARFEASSAAKNGRNCKAKKRRWWKDVRLAKRRRWFKNPQKKKKKKKKKKYIYIFKKSKSEKRKDKKKFVPKANNNSNNNISSRRRYPDRMETIWIQIGTCQGQWGPAAIRTIAKTEMADDSQLFGADPSPFPALPWCSYCYFLDETKSERIKAKPCEFC